MLASSSSPTNHCVAGPEPLRADRGDCVFFLMSIFFFLTTFALAIALLFERSRRISPRLVEARDVGSESPTTHTRKNSQPRFKSLCQNMHMGKTAAGRVFCRGKSASGTSTHIFVFMSASCFLEWGCFSVFEYLEYRSCVHFPRYGVSYCIVTVSLCN